MRFLLLGFLLFSVAAFDSASAQVDGADFDSMGPGPYPFGGGSPRILAGPPDAPGRVAILVAGGNPPGGAPPVPNAAGNFLCINMQNPPVPVPLILEFDFTCTPDPDGICQVEYDFSMAVWVDGSGIEVFVDAEGSYENTDDVHFPPVVFPPSTVEGPNTERTGVCDSSTHTIAFRVFPGTFLYLDNMVTECMVGNPVGVENRAWGQIRSLYR